MRAAIFERGGSTGNPSRRVTVPDDRAGGEPILDFVDSEAAAVALLEAIRRGDLPGAFGDYSIMPIDAEGCIMQRVPVAEAHEASTDAEFLVVNDATVKSAVSAMIASRQMYAMIYRELERHLGNLTRVGAAERKPNPAVMEVFIKSASNAAGAAFTEIDLFDSLTQGVFPWLQSLVREHIDQEKAEQSKLFAETEARRRAVPVPVGFPVVDTEGVLQSTLDRKRSLVLAGYQPIVNYFLARAVTEVLQQSSLATATSADPAVFTVIHFSTKPAKKSDMENPRLVRIGDENWTFKSSTKADFKRRLAEVFELRILPALRGVGMPDLIVVDDLMRMISAGIISPDSIPNPWKASTAIRWLLEWSEHMGAALLCGLPGASDRTLEHINDWSMLTERSTVLGVTADRKAEGLKPGQVMLAVGGVGGFIADATVLEPQVEILRGN